MYLFLVDTYERKWKKKKTSISGNHKKNQQDPLTK